jgi:hypothetical protein
MPLSSVTIIPKIPIIKINGMVRKIIDYEDYEDDEIEYSQEEKSQVIGELQIGLMLNEITICTSKSKLKGWWSNIQMKKENINGWKEYCPNISGQDLIEIAKEQGFKI